MTSQEVRFHRMMIGKCPDCNISHWSYKNYEHEGSKFKSRTCIKCGYLTESSYKMHMNIDGTYTKKVMENAGIKDMIIKTKRGIAYAFKRSWWNDGSQS